ncbi:MAG: hypothetical protein H7175_26415 [Burkholderiales bacterium]|nr:hypothetical protein [Anaerolineae bacterium]
MLTSVEGVYRNGKIELVEQPNSVPDETRVIVTFLAPKGIDLRALGVDKAQAAEIRDSLSSFAEDWNRPEMDAYDDYDAAKAKLQTR